MFLWQRALAEEPARTLWQPLRHRVSLAVQLTLVILLALALAEPQFPRPRFVVLVLGQLGQHGRGRRRAVAPGRGQGSRRPDGRGAAHLRSDGRVGRRGHAGRLFDRDRPSRLAASGHRGRAGHRRAVADEGHAGVCSRVAGAGGLRAPDRGRERRLLWRCGRIDRRGRRRTAPRRHAGGQHGHYPVQRAARFRQSPRVPDPGSRAEPFPAAGRVPAFHRSERQADRHGAGAADA